MRVALEWLLPSQAAAAICTDSQSRLNAIQSGSEDTADLRRMLNKRAGKTTLLWIPGHHGIAGNEEVDACAKQAAAITGGAPRIVSFATASALTCRTLTDPPPCHCCGEEPQTVEHWLQRCPNAVALRHQLFGVPSPPLSVLTTNPGSMLALARKILL